MTFCRICARCSTTCAWPESNIKAQAGHGVARQDRSRVRFPRTGRRPGSPFPGAQDASGASSSARPSAQAGAGQFSWNRNRPEPRFSSTTASSAQAAATHRVHTGGADTKRTDSAAGPFSWSTRGQQSPPQQATRSTTQTGAAAQDAWRTRSAADRPAPAYTSATSRAKDTSRAADTFQTSAAFRNAEAARVRAEAAKAAEEARIRAEAAKIKAEAARAAREREARARQEARAKAQRDYEARREQARRDYEAKREQARQESSRRTHRPAATCGAMSLTQACALLCVAYPCTLDDIKSAYRKQARRHHPDLGGDEEMMKSLNQAYELALSWCSPLRGKPSSWAA